MKPVLLLEINEVPLRVWKKYAADSRFPSIAKILEESVSVETIVTDDGELSPWCTWPTFHRGLSKQEHGILHLGQDPATFRGKPLWTEFRDRGLSVGVFGSLQSWPPRDAGPGGFYVPDTFAADSRCFPEYIEPVQAFNLSQVRANGRVMKDRALDRSPKLNLFTAMIRSGVRPTTLFRVLSQLVGERLNPTLRERRVSFQAIIFWDIFRAHFNPLNPPAFTTFFTNHVASVMHRYWSHLFPEDFPIHLRPLDQKHGATMDFAMNTLEAILKEALEWRAVNPEILLLVANSMGQAAVLRETHQGFELLLRDPLKLLRLLFPDCTARQNLAMMPQVSLEFSDEPIAKAAAESFQKITTCKGGQVFSCDVQANTLSVTCFTPREEELSANVVLVNGHKKSLDEAGLAKVKVEAGTGYHVPQGVIFAHGLSPAARKPMSVKASEAKPLILEWAGF